MYAPQDLSAFVAVAETGSVRAAAARICRTQSAVSQALKRLEAAVGFPLMDRTDYRIRLSPRGEQFAKRAVVLLKQGDGLRQFAQVLAAGTEERVCLAVHGALPTTAWIDALATAGPAFPDTVIEVVADEVDAPLERLIDGRAELALLLLPPFSSGLDAMEHRRIGSLAFANVAPRDLAPADIEALPQIVVSSFGDSPRSFGVAPGRRYWRVSTHAVKAELIGRGLGWGNLPEHLVDPVRMRNLANDGQTRSTHDFYLYRRSDASRGPVATALWESFPAIAG